MKQYQPIRVFLSLLVFAYLFTEGIKAFRPTFPELTKHSTQQNNQWVLGEMLVATQVTIVAALLTYFLSGLFIKIIVLPTLDLFSKKAESEQDEDIDS